MKFVSLLSCDLKNKMNCTVKICSKVCYQMNCIKNCSKVCYQMNCIIKNEAMVLLPYGMDIFNELHCRKLATFVKNCMIGNMYNEFSC